MLSEAFKLTLFLQLSCLFSFSSLAHLCLLPSHSPSSPCLPLQYSKSPLSCLLALRFSGEADSRWHSQWSGWPDTGSSSPSGIRHWLENRSMCTHAHAHTATHTLWITTLVGSEHLYSNATEISQKPNLIYLFSVYEVNIFLDMIPHSKLLQSIPRGNIKVMTVHNSYWDISLTTTNVKVRAL